MISAGELDSLKAENLRAMPDTATVLRSTPTRTASGGSRPNYTAHHTTPCRFTASVMSGGAEQQAAGQLVPVMAYTLTVPAGTDIRSSDQIQLGTSLFEVGAGKREASWNMSDSYTLQKIGE